MVTQFERFDKFHNVIFYNAMRRGNSNKDVKDNVIAEKVNNISLVICDELQNLTMYEAVEVTSEACAEVIKNVAAVVGVNTEDIEALFTSKLHSLVSSVLKNPNSDTSI